MDRIAAEESGRETFPDVADEIGEDPARFLDVDVLADDGARELLLSRIRGIDRLGTINAWIIVERKLERGPRDRIVELLERRREHLLETGGRPRFSGEELDERLRARRERREAAEADQEPEPDPVWRHVKCGSTDVERECSRTWICNECDERTNRVEEIDEPRGRSGNISSGSTIEATEDIVREDDVADQAVATDGGEPEC